MNFKGHLCVPDKKTNLQSKKFNRTTNHFGRQVTAPFETFSIMFSNLASVPPYFNIP